MNEFGGVLQDLMEARGLRGSADLSEVLEDAGRDVPEERIEAFMEGKEWVHSYFPGWVAQVLDLDAEEMGALAHAVAYGQTEYPPLFDPTYLEAWDDAGRLDETDGL